MALATDQMKVGTLANLKYLCKKKYDVSSARCLVHDRSGSYGKILSGTKHIYLYIYIHIYIHPSRVDLARYGPKISVSTADIMLSGLSN